MNYMPNQPISFDHHGNIPLSTPFKNISPKDIHIYVDVDTFIGAKTCGQACNHCWFVNYPQIIGKSFDLNDGVKLCEHLRELGYTVFPRYTDSFAYAGQLMKKYGQAQARTYFEDVLTPTARMEKGEAWTSGRPLTKSNYSSLLRMAEECGYGTITMTFHGLLNRNGILIDKNYPIKGVISTADFMTAINNIKAYNQMRKKESGDSHDAFNISVGITIGKHNLSKKMLNRYVKFFDSLGVQSLRFNRFYDHGNKHPHLTITEDEVKEVYKNIKAIHETKPIALQLGISEDFGTSGISVMGFPPEVGICRAGHQLFAIIPTSTPKILENNSEQVVAIIGDVVGCVNVFEPKVGEVFRVTSGIDNSISYRLQFDQQAIARLMKKRMDQTFTNGCFAPELMAEIKAANTSTYQILSTQPVLPKTTRKTNCEE